MKKIFTNWAFAFVTLFILTWVGLQEPQVKEILRLKSFDLLFQSQQKEISKDIVVITIDEKSIEKNGQWPWKRDVLADTILQLSAQGAGVIVLPILFSEPDRLGGDDYLAKVLENSYVVVAQTGSNQTTKNGYPRGVAKIGNPLEWLFSWPGMVGPIPEIGDNAAGVGVTNVSTEIDGVVRRMPLLMKIGNDVYPNIAIEVIRVAVGDPSYQVKSGASGIIAMRVPGFATIKTDQHARIWLSWNKSYPEISLADLDTNEISLRGKTIIIGMKAEGLGGVIASPTGPQYDYVAVASTVQTVIDGINITRVDISWLLELTLAFLVGSCIIVVTRFTPYYIVGGLMLAFSGIAVYSTTYFFNNKLMLVDVTWILVTIMFVGLHSIFNRFILEFKLKQQIRKQFESYLDPRQVAILQKDPSKLKLGGERREMSFLFMDIVGFTPISEHYKNNDDPEGLVVVINDYLNRMSKIVLDNGGTIDKYMGDCIMAFWNAPLDCPNHAEMAVKTSIECAKETALLKKEFKDKGLPEINIGSGVNTGTCIVGNMGSDMRFDYSVIGDAVNLAARLEAATRNYKDKKGNILATLYSSYTMEQLKDVESIEVDKIKVKGKEELITIYKPVMKKEGA
ncbi:adenylate/guanylate cyclase domain-containing protein [bacterium]|nr:adenylate/guanylate cyclase domain-containing protein [bacterium]